MPKSKDVEIRILKEDLQERNSLLKKIRDTVLRLDLDIDTEGLRWEINALIGE